MKICLFESFCFIFFGVFKDERVFFLRRVLKTILHLSYPFESVFGFDSFGG